MSARAPSAAPARSRRAVVPAATPFLYVGVFLVIQAGLLATGHTLAGGICDAVLVLLLVNGEQLAPLAAGRRTPDPDVIAGLRALAVVALIPVLAVGLPLRDGSAAAALLLVSVLSAATALAVGAVSGVPVRRMLAVRAPRAQTEAVCAGLALGLAAYLLGAPRLWAGGAASSRIAVAVVAAGAAAVAEEIVFRGLVQQALRRIEPRAGLAAASALFAASYLGTAPAGAVLAVTAAGVLFGRAVVRSGSLSGAILGHAALALGAGAVWPELLGSAPAGARHSAALIALAALVVVAVGVVALRTPAADLLAACAERIGLPGLLAGEPSPERDAAVAMVVRSAGSVAAAPVAAERRAALSWLVSRRAEIEARLLSGARSPLTYTVRDGAPRAYGVLSDADRRPVAVQLQAGAADDPAAVTAAVAALEARLGVHAVRVTGRDGGRIRRGLARGRAALRPPFDPARLDGLPVSAVSGELLVELLAAHLESQLSGPQRRSTAGRRPVRTPSRR